MIIMAIDQGKLQRIIYLCALLERTFEYRIAQNFDGGKV